MDNKYCSARFKTGEDLDNALAAALACGDAAKEAEASAKLAGEKASQVQRYAETIQQGSEVASQAASAASESAVAAAKSAEEAKKGGATHWDNLDGKPFDAQMVSEEVFSANRLSFTPTGSGYALYTEMNTLLDLVPGRVYTVSWAGEEFQCAAKAFEDDENDAAGVVLGECAVHVPNTPAGNGEPFGIATIRVGAGSSYTMTHFISHNGAYTGPVEIRFEGEVVTPLDPKFIILTSPSGTRYNLSVSDDGTLSAVVAT